MNKVTAEIPWRNLNYKRDNGNLRLAFVKLDTGLLLFGCLHKVCAGHYAKPGCHQLGYLQSRFLLKYVLKFKLKNMSELKTTLCLHESFVIMQIKAPFKAWYLPIKRNSVFSKNTK